MNNRWIVVIAAILFSAGVWATDEEGCLECHVPEEDWEGLSAEEILETAADSSIKRHKDNTKLTDEQLRAIVDTLLNSE